MPTGSRSNARPLPKQPRGSFLGVTFAELRDAVFGAHRRGDYEAGLDAISSYSPVSEDETVDLAFWKVCLLSRLGRLGDACAEFAASLNKGHWWSEAVLLDPDLDNLAFDPRWASLLARSIRRAEAAKRASRPLVDLVPSGRISATLVLLHGRAERPQVMIDRCASAAHRGCRLIALHGPEPYASNKYGWPLDDCERAVIDQLATADAVHLPILLGFSQGAGLAAWLGLSGAVPCTGLILVAPAMNIRGVPIPSAALKRVPTFIEVGTDDWAIHDARRAATALEVSGVPVRLEERIGLDHEWPTDSGEWLSAAIDWVVRPI